MKRQLLLLAALIFGGAAVWADDASSIEISKPAAVSETNMPTPDNGEETETVASTLSEEALAAAGEYRSFESIAPGASRLGGPITTYVQKDNLYWEITPAQLGVDYIMVISIARGIGESELYGGQSWNFGNDMIWRFRKVGDRIQFLRRNYRYRANKGPDSEALKVAYADSVVFSLPIVASGPQGGDVIDVTGLFMSDTLANVSGRALTGFSFDRTRSRWESIKGLKDNVEIEVEATYGGRAGSSDTVIDTRGVSINVHYSISRLKDEGYKPRYADERVGYFNSAICDVSDLSPDGNFKRYIDRWHIEKLEPEAEKSLPKKPLVFWLDKATPHQYRKLLRDGILEWNRAFEQAGFYDAVEVRQQEDNDDWDPEDINYNTIRWSVSQTGFAIGPRRVNPMTGQILDADVVLTVGFLSSWTRQFDLYSPQQLADKFSGVSAAEAFQKAMADGSYDARKSFAEEDTELFYSQQFGLANTFFDVMAIADETASDDAAAQAEAAQVAEEEAKKAAEEAAAKAAEAVAKAQEEAKKVAEEAAAKAAEAAAKAQEEAKKLAEELAKADEAVKAELTA
ncbi:MAG: DUF5117 domain-containing protein, partial [Thermoguttaceae bacterium]|nr:DUF5117 domain-containing protein [Thermoguttaceae bacterium]